MPQINRIRVNNIKYNFGTQFYDDFVMRFSCRNSLYDLANGGGKSVLMLLLMQNLIPNCTLDDKQPVEKLFRSGNDNTVIHSLVEWKLDACDMRDGFKYMTTGFCARKGKDTGEDVGYGAQTANIEYFNYCIFYKEFGENDIKNLPLMSNGERVTYNGLKTYLRGLEKRDSGLEVHIFDRKGDYQNFIGNYGLYESQWEIVRGINRTEGHVRTYFENSYKTTRKIIEDLLIGEIIEKSYNNRIRKGESDDEEMAQTLLDIKDKLVELSRRKDESRAYDRQIELLTDFGAGLDGLRTLYADRQKVENGLLQCLMGCRAKLAGSKKEARRLEEQGEKIDADYREAARLLSLAELEIEYAGLDRLKIMISEVQTRRDAVLQEKKQLEGQLKLKEAAAEYADYLEYKRRYDEVRELINSQSTGTGELVTELGRLAATKLGYVEAERSVLLARGQEERDEAQKAAVKRDEAKAREQELFAAINSYRGTIRELTDRKKKLDESIALLMQGREILTADGAESLIAENAKQTDALKRSIEDFEKALERNEKEQIELQKKQTETEAALFSANDELYMLEGALAKAVESQEKLAGIMDIYGVTESARLAETVEYIYMGLTADKIAVKKELDTLTAYRDSVTKHSLPGYDAGFMSVLTYLKGRYGDDIEAGREFMENMSAQEAAEAVSVFPMLPYVILAGETYENVAADKVITSMTAGSYIIPILPKASWRDGIKCSAAYKDMSFLWDDTALAAELDRVGEDIARHEESLRKLEDKCEVVRTDLTAAQLLRQADEPGEIKDRIFKTKNRISEYNERIEALEKELVSAKAGMKEQKENIAGYRQRLEELNETAIVFAKIREQNNEACEVSFKLSECAENQKEAERDYGLVKTEFNHASNLYAEHILRADGIQKRLEELERDFADNFKQYLTPDAVPFANMTKEQTDARAGALRSLLNEEQGEAADKEKLLAVYETSMRKCIQNMRYAGMTPEEAERLYGEGNLIRCSVDEMLKLKEQIAGCDRAAEELRVTLDSHVAQKNRIVGSCEHGRKLYEEKFGTFERQNTDDPEAAIIRYKAKIAELKEQKAKLAVSLKELENSDRDKLVMEKDMERIVKNAGLAVPDTGGYDDADAAVEASVDAAAVGAVAAVGAAADNYEEILREYERVGAEENRLKSKFYRDKQTLLEELDKCRAYELAQEFRTVMEFPLDAAEVDAAQKGINETNECILLERDRIEKSMRDMEKIKDSFEERCVQICANIRTELDRLPKLSRITLGDEVIPIVTLYVPYIKEEMYKERMSVYINETVSGAETFDDYDGKLKYIRGRLSWKKLFSVIVTDMNSIKLCLYKREHIKDQSRYLRYEEAVGSTGQSQGIYIQFLIAVINYISNINAAGKDVSVSGKTIFIDNPFGAAKDVYIWEPIFKMLATNHIQLVVPARGVTPAITRMFDVNYILGQKLAAGRQQTVVVDYRSQIQAEKMDYVQLEYEQASFDFF